MHSDRADIRAALPGAGLFRRRVELVQRFQLVLDDRGDAASDIVHGPLTAFTGANATGGIQGGYHQSSSAAFAGSQYLHSNYWVDVQVDDNAGAAPAAIAARFAAVQSVTVSAGSGDAAAPAGICAASAGIPAVTVMAGNCRSRGDRAGSCRGAGGHGDGRGSYLPGQ